MIDKKIISTEAAEEISDVEELRETPLEKTKEQYIPTRGNTSDAEADELRKKIEAMNLSDELKKKTVINASGVESLDEVKKLEHLLKIAQKDVVEAVHTAKKMDDRILDKLHDLLIEKGYYKNL